MLLPKKPSAVDKAGNEHYCPEDLRPLSIVNTDNRILANVMRRPLADAAEKFCDSSQHGFINGRSIVRCILDVDKMQQNFANLRSPAASIFFDIKAAFPSMAHSYIFTVLRKIGVH